VTLRTILEPTLLVRPIELAGIDQRGGAAKPPIETGVGERSQPDQ
jgi:hypothetical protein